MSRPTKEAEPGTQVTISLRVPAELKKQLEERAAANHRNLSQEAERALERSFNPGALFVDAVKATEGVEDRKKIADLVRLLTIGAYGLAATNAGLAIMRLLSAWEVYGEHFIPNQDDLDMCRTTIAALNVAVRQSEEAQRSKEGAPPASAEQLRNAMAARIAIGEWKPNTAIPKESELAREYGVSAKTMREAMDLMERDGLLTRRADPRRQSMYLVGRAA